MAFDLVPISQLPPAVDPIDPGSSQFPVEMQGVTYRIPGAAFVLPEYPLLTFSNIGALTGARVLTAGAGITFSTLTPGQLIVSAALSNVAILFNSRVVASPTGTENDYNPTGWNGSLGRSALWLEAAAAGTTLTGLDASAVSDGQAVALKNTSATDLLTLAAESSDSAAVNRFETPGGGDFTIIPKQIVFLIYDSIATRWSIAA